MQWSREYMHSEHPSEHYAQTLSLVRGIVIKAVLSGQILTHSFVVSTRARPSRHSVHALGLKELHVRQLILHYSQVSGVFTNSLPIGKFKVATEFNSGHVVTHFKSTIERYQSSWHDVQLSKFWAHVTQLSEHGRHYPSLKTEISSGQLT